jgi:hypothetical protein
VTLVCQSVKALLYNVWQDPDKTALNTETFYLLSHMQRTIHRLVKLFLPERLFCHVFVSLAAHFCFWSHSLSHSLDSVCCWLLSLTGKAQSPGHTLSCCYSSRFVRPRSYDLTVIWCNKTQYVSLCEIALRTKVNYLYDLVARIPDK